MTQHEFLRALRKQMNMTQVELAKEIHLSQAAVSKIENGILKMGLEEFIRLSGVAKTKGKARIARQWISEVMA